jgi:hypothetical protein
VECRIGNLRLSGCHYTAGLAHYRNHRCLRPPAAAVGRLLNLSEQQMLWALGLASTQPVGLQEKCLARCDEELSSWGELRKNGMDIRAHGCPQLHDVPRKSLEAKFSAGRTC